MSDDNRPALRGRPLPPDVVEITGCDLSQFARDCYDMSTPLGLGHLHYTPGPLDGGTVEQILRSEKEVSPYELNMDYVLGRAVKMTVYRDDDGGLWIRDAWYDHSAEQYARLTERYAVTREKETTECASPSAANSTRPRRRWFRTFGTAGSVGPSTTRS